MYNKKDKIVQGKAQLKFLYRKVIVYKGSKMAR